VRKPFRSPPVRYLATGRTFVSGVASTRDNDEVVVTEVESRQSGLPGTDAAATAIAHQSLDEQGRRSAAAGVRTTEPVYKPYTDTVEPHHHRHCYITLELFRVV